MSEGLIRVISWNLHGARIPGRASKERQHKAWDGLRKMDPDLLLLQEVRLPGIPKWETEGWTFLQGAVGRYGKTQDWGSVIAARQDLQLEERDEVFADLGLQILYDYIVAGQVRLFGGRDIFVATVHTPAREFEEYVSTGNYGNAGLPNMDDLRRPDWPKGKPYLNDLAFRCLQRQVAGKRFIIGGDWNTSRGFEDEGAAFFRRAHSEGWTECHWVKNHQEARTFFGRNAGPYQLDHLFCDQDTGGCLEVCRVIDEAWARELSDHVPLMAEFRVSAGMGAGTA